MDFCSYQQKQAGSGQFGFLFYENHQTFAYKSCGSEGFGLTNLREIDITSRLKHPNILNRVGFISQYNCEAEEDALLIFPLIPFGLPNLYHQTTEKKLPVIKQLLDVVAFLHANGVIIHNLTPASILISDLEQPTVHLTDFSAAQLCHKNELIAVSGGQVSGGVSGQDDCYYQKSKDIWDLGALIGELLFGESIVDILKDWRLLALREKMTQIDPTYNTHLYKMIVDLTNPDPLLRTRSENIKMYFLNYPPPVIIDNQIDRSFVYGAEFRELLKLALKLMHRAKYTTKEFFLAIELLFRSAQFYSGDRKGLLITSIRIAQKFCRDQYQNNASFLKEFRSDLSSDELDHIELLVVTNLQGKIYYNQLFSLCLNCEAIDQAISQIVLDRERTAYSSYSLDKLLGTVDDPLQDLVIPIDEVIHYE